MTRLQHFGLWTVLALALPAAPLNAQSAKLKEEMRQPWQRSETRFIRKWVVRSDIPLASAAAFEQDGLAAQGGEAAIRPTPKTDKWRDVTSWGDAVDLGSGPGVKRDLAGYAFTTISRKAAGKALLSIGSDESVRAWVNGALVLNRRTTRQLVFDEDLVEVDLKAGANALLIKVEQRGGPWVMAARVLERGAIPPRVQEIGPSLMDDAGGTLVLRTDLNAERASLDKVTVQAVAAGGRILATQVVPRGTEVKLNSAAWPNGAYELRFSTRRMNGLLWATHIPWYKGDAVAASRDLVAAAAKADQQTPAGQTIRMLGDLVLDRLGKDLSAVQGNPWWAVHSALMEYQELKLEAAGKPARERAYGFYRLAWRDELDGSPQFCRAYLPTGYDRTKKWPLVVKLHGYNPENPDYIRWWSVDTRHNMADVEYAGRQGVIYVEPHGRNNNSYLGLGDLDVMRVIREAREKFRIDEDRIYLTGDSMGGWGTWNVGTRHPDLFAAIAPIYGGVDYHSTASEEDLAKMSPLDRFLQEKQSSWSLGEGLLHLPILVHHGDVDRSVNVEYSRYGVRMLERWGYNVRYVEMPGYGHEDLNILDDIIDWFLQHRRNANPPRVRIRTAELKNAAAYWARIEQAASPREFMELDAEVTGPNVVQVDTLNVLALSLAPPGADPARPVKVVWNGEAQTLKLEDGRVRLRAAGYTPGELMKNASVAGPLGDAFNTPFAVVVGTASADAAMNEVCRSKGQAAMEFWRTWQRQPLRLYKDSELSDQDAAKYSLILIGGPDANLVARKLASKLPVAINGDEIRLGGRAFKAPDARVQMIYPNPLNPTRYVALVAATSPGAMYFWSPDRMRSSEFDFTIEDGRVSDGRQRLSATEIWVAGGWFDPRWQVRDELLFAGKPDVREKAVFLPAPRPGQTLETRVAQAYSGAYQIAPGLTIKVEAKEGRLIAQVVNQPPVELYPAGGEDFVILEGPLKITFEKDAAGKVTSFKGWQGGREFTAKKVE